MATIFEGAEVILPDTVARVSVRVEDGRITGIDCAADGARRIDARGLVLAPALVDIHGDAFERHIAPRPSAPFPIEAGLRSTDREAASHGITTAWLAQCWSWEGGMRGPDFAEAVMAAMETYRPRALTDLRVQIRCETHMVRGIRLFNPL